MVNGVELYKTLCWSHGMLPWAGSWESSPTATLLPLPGTVTTFQFTFKLTPQFKKQKHIWNVAFTFSRVQCTFHNWLVPYVRKLSYLNERYIIILWMPLAIILYYYYLYFEFYSSSVKSFLKCLKNSYCFKEWIFVHLHVKRETPTMLDLADESPQFRNSSVYWIQ